MAKRPAPHATLTTPRLRLGQFHPEDADAMHECFADPEAMSRGSRFAARPDRELPQDGRHVMVDRLLRDEEPLGDLTVPEPLPDEREHVEFPRGETGWIGAGRGSGSGANAENAVLTKRSQDARCRP